MNNNNDYKQKSSGKWKGLIIAFIFAVAATTGAKTCAYYIEKNNSKDETSTTNEGKEPGTEHTPGVGEKPGDDSGENDGSSTGDNPVHNAPSNKFSVSGISGDHQYIICNGDYTAKQAESFQIPGYHLATVTSGEDHVYIMSLMGELEEQSDGYWMREDHIRTATHPAGERNLRIPLPSVQSYLPFPDRYPVFPQYNPEYYSESRHAGTRLLRPCHHRKE